jgi:hypothetical protein
MLIENDPHRRHRDPSSALNSFGVGDGTPLPIAN